MMIGHSPQTAWPHLDALSSTSEYAVWYIYHLSFIVGNHSESGLRQVKPLILGPSLSSTGELLWLMGTS